MRVLCTDVVVCYTWFSCIDDWIKFNWTLSLHCPPDENAKEKNESGWKRCIPLFDSSPNYCSRMQFSNAYIPLNPIQLSYSLSAQLFSITFFRSKYQVLFLWIFGIEKWNCNCSSEHLIDWDFGVFYPKRNHVNFFPLIQQKRRRRRSKKSTHFAPFDINSIYNLSITRYL